MKLLPKPDAIIFDWDNTLVDTWPVIHRALNETMEAMGKPLWTLDETHRKVRRSMRDSFPEIFGEKWQEAGEYYRTRYKAHHLDSLLPLMDAQKLLDELLAHDLTMVVVSNKLGGSLRQEISHLGWDKYFKGIVGSADARNDKPHPDPVHMALEKTTIKPNASTWFVGDSEVDLECAINTGCTAVLYGELVLDHPEYTADSYHGFPYHAHVHNHRQMLELVEKAFK